MNRAGRRLFLSGMMACGAGAVYGQRVEVRKSGAGRVGISLDRLISDGSAEGQEFIRVLRADLLRSGWFEEQAAAQLVVVGRVQKADGLRAEIQAIEVADKKRVLSRAFSGVTAATRALAHRVSDALVLAVSGMPGMASARLAMVGNRSGHKELYVCDADGANLRQVTQERSIVVAPAWMPDGKNILYTSYKRGYPNIYRTGQREAVSKFGGLNASAAVSPDGRYMAVVLSKDGNPELYIREISSGSLQRVSSTRRANEASPCWSPDGSQLAYVSDSSGRPHIYVLALKGGSPKRLSRMGSENVAPDWGVNGQLTYCSRQGGRYRIVVVDPRSGVSRVLPLDGADYEDPSWMPDGRHVVVSRSVNYRSSIYLLDTQEDRSIALKEGTGDWFSPACSR
jgi:TolB protein